MLALGGFAWEVALGAAARRGWTVPVPRPRFAHGASTRWHGPAAARSRCSATYHVSQQNTFTGRLTEAMLDEVLARARSVG